jgi:molybdate transport system substrate-binding protein
MWAAVWLVLAGFVSQGAQPLTVSAAVSLSEALASIAEAHQKAGGASVRFNFAASNVLARQIVNGAPVDVFISADAAQMDVAQRASAIDPATRVDVVGNRLAVLVRAGAKAVVREVRDLRNPDIRRIAIGSPEAVPAGVYAREWLQASRVWDEIEHKIVPVGSVRAALGAVENESVDAAIVYESDTLQARSSSIAFIVATEGPRIAYPAAVVARTRRPDDARRFVEFLRSRAAQDIFRRYRFQPISSP